MTRANPRSRKYPKAAPARARAAGATSKAAKAKNAKAPKPKPKPTAKAKVTAKATNAKPKATNAKKKANANARLGTLPMRSANAKAAPKGKATAARKAKGGATRTSKPRAASADRWRRYVEQYGVVLASARGPVPNVAEQVAGEPIIGSWWSHPDAHEIFDALSRLDDDLDIRCFRLVDGKVTFVHRRMWPALVRLARDGVLAPERVAAIQQEHMPTGEHRNLITPFPDWVPDDAAEAAEALTTDSARSRLGDWL